MILQLCSEWGAPKARLLQKLEEMRAALLQKIRHLNELMAATQPTDFQTLMNDDVYQLMSKVKQAHHLFETLITQDNSTVLLKKWMQTLKDPYYFSEVEQCISNITHHFLARDPYKAEALFCMRQIQNNYESTQKIMLDHIEHKLLQQHESPLPLVPLT